MPKRKDYKNWLIKHKKMSKEALKLSFFDNLEYTLSKDQYTATFHDTFLALAITLRDRVVERWITTQQGYHNENVKRVYYLSMEFLIGRLLENNILNLGLWREVNSAIDELGLNLDHICELEHDAGLGNGGLGRLAACYLDSMATLGIPGHGYGIRYDYGIFNQKVVNGYQVEQPDEWLKNTNPWEFARPEYTVRVQFKGQTSTYQDEEGHERIKWSDTDDVLALPFDMPVVGFQNDVVNTLRLWSARSTEEFDFGYFNDGDYEGAVYNKVSSENISKVLYPNDNIYQGRELRLRQEYFFTAASMADIIRRFSTDNSDIRLLPEKVAIQLNDTHPSLAIVELMRILLDEKALDWESAWDITVKIFAYTNHTVMPEALEKWSITLLEKLLPRHLQIIYEINSRLLSQVSERFPGDAERLQRMSIIEEGEEKKILMAYLSIVGSHSTNGVSRLHTKLIKEGIFKDFDELFPERFNNKTNGITQRRWLRQSNERLSGLINATIGDRWITSLYELEKLLPLKDDAPFQDKWRKIKQKNKRFLANYISERMGIKVDPHSMFDVHVKRIHEYKRQVLFTFYMISQFLRIKKFPKDLSVPRTFIIGGKAAPGYAMAKLIIKFVNNVADIINNDRRVRSRLKVIFLENYRVSLAEKIFPASELSEQISTAGTEASGTGCMKFMANGALTIGTHDGANIEMAEALGEENIFMFGLKANEIQQLKNTGYVPQDYINRYPILKEIMGLIKKDFFSPNEHGIFKPLLESLLEKDPFFICADFDAYCAMQEKVSALYLQKGQWTKRSIINTAKSGRFSSDRAVTEYADDIWKVPCTRP